MIREHTRTLNRPGSSTPRRLGAWAALLAALAIVILACGGGSSPSVVNTGSTPDLSATETTTTSPAAPPATSTTGAPATATPHAPTATPLPALQSQIMLKSLGPINPNTNSTILDMTCPAGYLVAGGGPNSGYTNFTLMWNAPISTTTWRAEVFNSSSTDTISVQIQVVCLKVAGLTSQIKIQSLGAISANGHSTTDITCPSGYLVAGGGPNSGYAPFTLMWNAPISTTTWRAEIYNNSSGTMYAQIQVVCLAVSGLQGQVLTAPLYNSSGIAANINSTIVDKTCPSGYLVAGGGLKSGYQPFTVMWSAPTSTTTWRGEAFNNSSGAIFVDMQIICLKR